MNSQPITYTARARISGVTTSSSFGSGCITPCIEVHLTGELGAPVVLNGTLGFDLPPVDLPYHSADALYDIPVEITVRLMTKKTRLVPWKAEEVPLGAWFRWTTPDTRGHMVSLWSVHPEGITVSESGTLPYTYVVENMEHSIDGGKTWKAAGRVEEVYE